MKKGFLLFIAACCCSFAVFSQVVKPATDEVYQARLASIKSPVELIYRAEVKQYIDAYLNDPEKTRQIIATSKMYFPLIEKALKSRNVPIDLKYLAVAVSDLDASAQNPHGATGLWMMIYNVSKMYKLKVNSFIDERRDPYKSSAAMASHFRDLYSIYHQWPLVIAAYASSPVMLNKCIRMAGNSLYFWDVYPNLPESTKDIYPKYMAAVYIMNFYKDHGIRPIAPELVPAMDTVLVNKWLSFQQISATIDIPLETLRKLNPIFKKDVIPYSVEGYSVLLPEGKASTFDKLKDSVYNALPKSTDFSPVTITKQPADTSAKAVQAVNEPEKQDAAKEKKFDKKRVYYTVKAGDILADVADWFDVTAKEIKSWNKLKSDKLVKGKKLTIWVNEKKTGYYKRINTMTKAQKKKLRKKD